MKLTRTSFLFLGPFSLLSKGLRAQTTSPPSPPPSPGSGVIITPTTTTFGPPKPLNGQCPHCYTLHDIPNLNDMPTPLYTPNIQIDWLIRCKFCSAAFFLTPKQT